MKKLLPFLFFVSFSMALFSQPVINASFNPAPGDNYKYHPVNTVITPGASGANVTWDFSTVQIIYNPITGKYMSPSATPYNNDFPGCNVAYEDFFVAGTYHYYETTASKMEKKGYASVLVVANYSDPQIMFTYPFTYNTVVSDSFKCSAPVGTMVLDKTGHWEAKGDAYGTLRLPSGNYSNVLRIRTTSYTLDDYGSSVGNYEVDAEEYLWVSTTTKVPLLRIAVEYHFANGSPVDTIEYIRVSDEVSGVGDPEGNITHLQLYPNPASGTVNLEFRLNRPSAVALTLLSADGKIIRTQSEADGSTGFMRREMDISLLPKGLYFLKFEADGVNRVFKVLKN
ncbi:MAG TPA: T9SS type A sorting domain-containing protein [Bacteroidales bacterium]|nr:T9SS type A sorting domain-containing protein [Bacteroidales bacterium]HRZ48150.1 T9SS type A sorting domain-containing protein [Bacteroidales bacterium]